MFDGRVRYYALRAYRSIWFRPAAYALLAILTLALTPLASVLLPESWVYQIDRELVEKILDVLTASMLAVAIFSVTTMVNQLNAAAASATPRTRPLLAADRTAQNAISTFIGTFLFGVLGTIGIELDLYGKTGLFLVFVMSLLLIVLVTVNLILWIRRLSGMGGVGEAIERVEYTATTAFDAHVKAPWHGGGPAAQPPRDGHAVRAPATGFVQKVDVGKLAELAERLDTFVHLCVRPGEFVDRTRPVAVLGTRPDNAAREAFARALVIGDARDFNSDPLYGVEVLSEIASRALSPGINDSGTAMDVLTTLLRLLTHWRLEAAESEPEIAHPRVTMPDLDPADALTVGFRAISRDGADRVEVGIRLQQTLGALARLDPKTFGSTARDMAAAHVERSRRAIDYPPDIDRLERAFREAEHDKGRGDGDTAGARLSGESLPPTG